MTFLDTVLLVCLGAGMPAWKHGAGAQPGLPGTGIGAASHPATLSQNYSVQPCAKNAIPNALPKLFTRTNMNMERIWTNPLAWCVLTVFNDSKFMKCMFWNSLRVHASTSSIFLTEDIWWTFKWISPFFCLQRFLQFLKDRFSPTFLGCSKAADGMRHCQASSCLKESIRIHQRSPWQG